MILALLLAACASPAVEPQTVTITLRATVTPDDRPHPHAVYRDGAWRLHGAFIGDEGPPVLGDLVWTEPLSLEPPCSP